MKMKSALALLCATAFMAVSVPALAEETVSEKAEHKVDRAETKTRKAKRRADKQLRSATDSDNMAKDAEGHLKNAGDDVSDEAKEAKNKID